MKFTSVSRASVKAIAVAALFLSLTSIVNAEDHTRYGLKIGMTVSNVTDRVEEVYGPTDSRYGFTIGGSALIPWLDFLYVQPEFLYSTRGAKSAEYESRTGLLLQYIDIPVLLKLMVPERKPVRPFVYAGGAMDLLTGADIQFGNISVNATDDVTKFDFSVVLGGGFDIKGGTGAFSIEGRYMIGMGTIDDRRHPADIRNRSFSIIGGYVFR